MKLQVGVKALIKNNGKILLMKRSNKYKKTQANDIWDIPGGRINPGEEPEDGLKREIKEETGLDIEEIKQILDTSTVYKDKEKQIIRITYLCTAKNHEVKLSDEHTEYQWIKPENIDFKLKDSLIAKVVSQAKTI